jgi:hypothetical protein
MTTNELLRSPAELVPARPAPESSDRTPRYRPREMGVGYGRSSGYARARSFVAPRNDQALRCR